MNPKRRTALLRVKAHGPLLSDGLAARLRALREEGGWNRFALCRAAGVSDYLVAMIEAWGRTPLVDSVEKLARGLQVSPSHLAFGVQLPFDPSVTTPRYQGIGARLQLSRERRGRSQDELAAACCISPSTVLYLEDGRYLPSLPVSEALALALDVPAPWLVYGEGPDPFPPPAPSVAVSGSCGAAQTTNTVCDPDALPDRLKAARAAAGLSARALGLAAGISDCMIVAVERRRQLARVHIVEQLAHALGLSPSYLAFGAPLPAPSATDSQVAGLGARLRQTRERLAVTVIAVGKAAGMAWKTVGLIESANRMPRLCTTVKLAQVLDVPVSWLVYGEGPEPSATQTQPLSAPVPELPRAVQEAKRRERPPPRQGSMRLGKQRPFAGLGEGEGGLAGLPVRLRQIREELGLAGESFAHGVGLSSETILRIERGQVPNIATIEKVANAVHLSPGYLAFGDALPFAETETPRCEELGARLKLAMERRGLDRAAMMSALKVPLSSMVYWEEGGAPKVNRVAAMAGVLEVPPCWLAYGEGPAPFSQRRRAARTVKGH